MYPRPYQRTKDGKRHTYFALVESQRTAIFHTRHEDGRQLSLFLNDEHVPLPDAPDVVRVRLPR